MPYVIGQDYRAELWLAIFLPTSHAEKLNCWLFYIYIVNKSSNSAISQAFHSTANMDQVTQTPSFQPTVPVIMSCFHLRQYNCLCLMD